MSKEERNDIVVLCLLLAVLLALLFAPTSQVEYSPDSDVSEFDRSKFFPCGLEPPPLNASDEEVEQWLEALDECDE